VSDHPEFPRVEFISHQDGMSMNLEEAVDRFREMLKVYASWTPRGTQDFTLTVQVRPCDCETTLEGRDDHCPLHGDPEVIRSCKT
jgi:hypothetical protein